MGLADIRVIQLTAEQQTAIEKAQEAIISGTIKVTAEREWPVTLRKKLFMNTLIPIVLAMAMIGFIIIQTFTIQTTAQDDTKLLLAVKELEQSLVVASQSLNNFTYLDSEANKNEALAILQETKSNLGALASLTRIPEHQTIVEKIASKFENLEKATESGFQENNRSEIKSSPSELKGF